MIFVGEKRSNKAIEMGATWHSAKETKDGILCAKTLFRALRITGIEPKNCDFANWFEDEEQRDFIRKYPHTVIAMGNKVQAALKKEKIKFIPIIHPAARGVIRKKENYINHIKEQLGNIDP